MTFSGETAGIDEMAAKFAELEVFARKLKVDTAYHLPHMQIVAQDYVEYIGDIKQDLRPANVECIRASLDVKSRQTSLELPFGSVT